MLMEYVTGRGDEPWVEVREGFPEEVAIEGKSEGGQKSAIEVVEMAVTDAKTLSGRN